MVPRLASILLAISVVSCRIELPTSVIVHAGPSSEFAGNGRLAKLTVYAPRAGRRIASANAVTAVVIWQIVPSRGYFAGDSGDGVRVMYASRRSRSHPRSQEPPEGVICEFIAETANAPGVGGAILIRPMVAGRSNAVPDGGVGGSAARSSHQSSIRPLPGGVRYHPDTSSINPTTFVKVKDVLSKVKKEKCGERKASQQWVEDVFSFHTSGDQANVLGRANIDFAGMVEIQKDCSWCAYGEISMQPQYFNFNKSNRDGWAEFKTMIGRNLPGKPYMVFVVGTKRLQECGKL